MTYRDQPIGKRFSRWDDLSREKVQEYFKKEGWKIENFGFERSRIHTFQLPLRVRTFPDFIVQKDEDSWFVECKGCSGVLRLKFISLFGLLYWNGELPLRLAVYDSSVDRVFLFDCDQLLRLIATTSPKVDVFPDNKEPYVSIKMPHDAFMLVKALFRRLFK